MAITQVSTNDTFESWRLATNEIGNSIGDMDNLDVAGTTDLVSAVNAANANTADRGGLEKNSAGELQVNYDESLSVNPANELGLANDSVKNIHIHPSVAGPGLRQMQSEGLSVKHDTSLTISAAPVSRLGIANKGVSVAKMADAAVGAIISYGSTGAAVAVAPTAAGQTLVATLTGAPTWGNAAGVTLLGHSGYLITGKIANNQVGGTTTEVTIKSTVALTSPTNIAALPVGHQSTVSNAAAPAAWGATLYPIVDADSAFGHMWSCSEGIVVLRDSVYIMNLVSAMEDPAPGSASEVKCGMKIFNVGSDTFITFRIKSHGGHIYNQFIAKHLLSAELLRGATTPSVVYYNSTGTSQIDIWQIGVSYASGTIVKANSRLYKATHSGSVTSASGSEPSHIFHGLGIINGIKNMSDGTSWLVLADTL